jgi:glycosyltransferase involved in cell wall biosynthesis
MKIVQLSSGYKISYNGGITNYVRALSNELVAKGHEVYVIDSFKGDGGAENTDFLFSLISLNSNILRPFHLNSVIYNDDVIKLRKIFEDIKPDIIHIHMMIDLPADVIETAKEFSKVIISLHDYSYICKRITMIDSEGLLCKTSSFGENCNSCISALETNRYTKYITDKLGSGSKLRTVFPSKNNESHYQFMRKALSTVDMLIAVSSRVKEIYINEGFNNKKFIVNHIGNITAENPRNISYVKKELITICFIGNFSKYKGAELVLELASKLDPKKFKIELYGLLDNYYLELIRDYSNLTYNGKYKQEQLANILLNIDLGLVLPIWEDNAPQVVFELLNNGIPVIGTRMGGIPDFIQHGVNGLLIDRDKSNFPALISLMNSAEFENILISLTNMVKSTKKVSQHNSEIINLYLETLSEDCL